MERSIVESSVERIERLERTLAALREDHEVANILLGLSGAMAEVRSVDETLERAVRTVPGLFGAERALVGQWDALSESFRITHFYGYTEKDKEALRLRGEQGREAFPFLGRSIEERKPVFAAEPDASTGGLIAIPLFRWEADFGALRLEFPEPKEFSSRDRDLARGIAHQLGHALSNARRFNLLQNLRSFGSLIAERLKYGEVLTRIVSGAIQLLEAEGAWIYTVDTASGNFVSTAAHEGGLSLPERLTKVSLSDEPWSRVAQGETVVWPDAAADFYSPVPLIVGVTPLSTRSGTFGALMVANSHASGLGPDDKEALCVLAAQGAQALENSRRFERERSVARSLQRGLLRTESPDLQGCDLGALYEPADAEADIGGDFYDLIDLPHNRVGLVVGDVSGKGAEAAAQTAMVKYMLRAFAIQDESPATTLYRLNNALARDLSEDRFITLVYATFDPKTERCSIAGAGHPPTFIYRGDRGEADRFHSQGPIIGAFENETFGQITTDIFPGDVLLAYTDGLTEARLGVEMFGEARVEAYLIANHSRPAEQLVAGLFGEARRFGSVNDDTVIMALAPRSSS